MTDDRREGKTQNRKQGKACFWKSCISKNSVLQDQDIFSKIHKKSSKKNFAPPPYGAAPLPPTKVGAKCLAAAVLAHRDRVLSPQFSHYRQHQDDEAAQYRGFKVVFCARPFLN